jgi:DNA-binding MarR family transcriptional regulator
LLPQRLHWQPSGDFCGRFLPISLIRLDISRYNDYFNIMSSLMEELKQTKPFEHIEEEVFLNLQRTAQALSSSTTGIFKSVDLTPVQYNVLRILRGSLKTGLLCGEISERLVTKDSDITRLLDRLENRGLVMRERDTKDRRAVISRITEKGLKVLTELDEPMINCIKEQFSHFGDGQLKQLNDLLELARNKAK